MTADVEDQYIVCQAAEPVDEDGCLINARITCRHRDEIIQVEPGVRWTIWTSPPG